jgi:hypothetical protein
MERVWHEAWLLISKLLSSWWYSRHPAFNSITVDQDPKLMLRDSEVLSLRVIVRTWGMLGACRH